MHNAAANILANAFNKTLCNLLKRLFQIKTRLARKNWWTLMGLSNCLSDSNTSNSLCFSVWSGSRISFGMLNPITLNYHPIRFDNRKKCPSSIERTKSFEWKEIWGTNAPGFLSSSNGKVLQQKCTTKIISIWRSDTFHTQANHNHKKNGGHVPN